MASRTLTVAACNWRIRPACSFQDFADHFHSVLDAVGECDLVVLPELIVLELFPLLPSGNVKGLAQFQVDFEELARTAARERHFTLVAGTHFATEGDTVSHMCRVYTPDGNSTSQPKNVLTQFESQEWALTSKPSLSRQSDPELGVLVCYDSEFPEAGRALAESGVLVLCVPSYTETEYGYHRVRYSCHARAIENQIYVVHTALTGSLGAEPVPTTYGSSAIIGPSVAPFPSHGVIAESGFNDESFAKATLDLDALLQSRNEGDVRNWHDRHASPWEFGS